MAMPLTSFQFDLIYNPTFGPRAVKVHRIQLYNMPIVGNTQNATTQVLGTAFTPTAQSSVPPLQTSVQAFQSSALALQSSVAAAASSVLDPWVSPEAFTTEESTNAAITTAESMTAALATIYTYNASVYSHSTVFVTDEQAAISLASLNIADLTTIYTPSPACADRWMLAGGQTITRFAPGEATPIPVTVTETAAVGITPQNFTMFSMNLNGSATDPVYRSCQAYNVAPTYSPGLCPQGQTVAEITAYQVSDATAFHTFWQASCCRSGFTFGPEYPVACISTFTTPVPAYALVTSTPSNGALPSTVYEYQTSSYNDSLASWSTYQASTTTLATGLAIADPVVVLWQTNDYSIFPSDYAASLVQRFSLDIPTDTGDPKPRISPPSSGLSTGAKAGIGVGVALGFIAILGVIVVWCLVRRRHKKQDATTTEQNVAEMADTDQDLANKKWWAGGKWRSEANTQPDQQELDSKTVHVVPGPPQELDGAEMPHPNHVDRMESR